MLTDSTKPLSDINKKSYRNNLWIKRLIILLVALNLVLIGYIIFIKISDITRGESLTREEYFSQLETKDISKTEFNQLKFKNTGWTFASRTGKIKTANTDQELEQLSGNQFANYLSLVRCGENFCRYNAVVEMHNPGNYFETGDNPGIDNCNYIVSDSFMFKVNSNISRYLVYCGPTPDTVSSILFTSLSYPNGKLLNKTDKEGLVLTALFSAYFTDENGDVTDFNINEVKNTYGFMAAEKSLKGVSYD